MAFSEIELKRCEKALAQFLERRRPPVHIRDQLDISYRITGHSVEIFEVRPDWKNPALKTELPVAKATYVRTRNHWKAFWMRQDLKWHNYEPNSVFKTLAALLDAVDSDEYGCFFG